MSPRDTTTSPPRAATSTGPRRARRVLPEGLRIAAASPTIAIGPAPEGAPADATLVSARGFDEYLTMFALDPRRLAGRTILDCPGGASTFRAEAAKRGADAVAADPVYALETDDLIDLAHREAERGNAFCRANHERYTWEVFASPEDHDFARLRTVRGFAADLRQERDAYVAAELPDLPFGASSFDLVLSSHLLFSYDDRFDLDFHVAAVLELLRVARQEVRIFPTLSPSWVRSVLCDPVLATLRGAGFDAFTHRSRYGFQTGGDEMLVLRRARPGLTSGRRLRRRAASAPTT